MKKVSTLSTTTKVRTFAALSGVAFVAGGVAPWAQALPPGGAGADTPGTYSSVSPSEVEQCGYLDFEVGGFPAGEIVNIKIDDGEGFGGDMAIQGQGVIARHKIDSDGTASGSIQIPCDLPAGSHHLRYLATEGERNLGYTHRGGSDFTVIAAANDTGNSGGGGGNSLDSGGDSGESTDQQSNRGGGGRVVASRGGNTSGDRNGNSGNAGGSQEEVVEEIVYVDEGPAGNGGSNRAGGNGGSNRGGGSGGINSSAGGNARKSGSKSALNTAAAKPKLDSKTGNKEKSTSSKAGIFDKDEDKKKKKEDNSTQAAATGAQGPNSTPYIGLFVGGAILLVGMTAINVWLFTQRRR